jgi:hypothetical protein
MKYLVELVTIGGFHEYVENLAKFYCQKIVQTQNAKAHTGMYLIVKKGNSIFY